MGWLGIRFTLVKPRASHTERTKRRRGATPFWRSDHGTFLSSRSFLEPKKPMLAHRLFESFVERPGLLALEALVIPDRVGLERLKSRTSCACSFFGIQRLPEASFLRRQKPKKPMLAHRLFESFVERPGLRLEGCGYLRGSTFSMRSDAAFGGNARHFAASPKGGRNRTDNE